MRKLILPMVVITLLACSFPIRANAELSATDKDFLLNQCQVSQEDIDVIPKLSKETQANISALIATKDPKQLIPFKNTRDYYRKLLQLKPKEPLPFTPYGMDKSYFTDEEYANWQKIYDDAPW